MIDGLIKKCRGDHCFGKSCDHCRFIKEDKIMTNEEALRKEIDETMKQLDILQKKLEEVKNEVPETLDINDGDKYWCVDGVGNICWTFYAPTSISDATYIRNRRAFLSKEYAEAFAEKTQFIADMLHFKYLYDRDHKPDWNSEDEGKYGIYYDIYTKRFTGYCSAAFIRTESVYFSTRELANRCAKWLNKKYGYTKE